ncbi:MAG: alpha/beta fold hydrolase [Polyangiaceae bacterium]
MSSRGFARATALVSTLLSFAVACSSPAPSSSSAASSANAISSALASAVAAPSASSRRPAAAAGSSTVLPDGTLSYIEITTGQADASQPLPLVVGLHGFGDRPDNFIHVVKRLSVPARVVALRAPTKRDDGFSWFEPVAKLSDRDGDAFATDISWAVSLVASTVEQLAKTKPTVGKPIVFGFSQGGMLSWAMAVAYPERVAAVLPIAGMLPRPLYPPPAPPNSPVPMSSLPPVFAFHGEADERVPFSQGARTARALESAGYPLKMQSFPNVQHTIPEHVRDALLESLKQVISDQGR